MMLHLIHAVMTRSRQLFNARVNETAVDESSSNSVPSSGSTTRSTIKSSRGSRGSRSPSNGSPSRSPSGSPRRSNNRPSSRNRSGRRLSTDQRSTSSTPLFMKRGVWAADNSRSTVSSATRSPSSVRYTQESLPPITPARSGSPTRSSPARSGSPTRSSPARSSPARSASPGLHLRGTPTFMKRGVWVPVVERSPDIMARRRSFDGFDDDDEGTSLPPSPSQYASRSFTGRHASPRAPGKPSSSRSSRPLSSSHSSRPLSSSHSSRPSSSSNRPPVGDECDDEHTILTSSTVETLEQQLRNLEEALRRQTREKQRLEGLLQRHRPGSNVH